MFIAGYDLADRARVRGEVVAAEVDAARDLGPAVDAIARADCTCVFGNREIIEASSGGLTVIDLLNE